MPVDDFWCPHWREWSTSFAHRRWGNVLLVGEGVGVGGGGDRGRVGGYSPPGAAEPSRPGHSDDSSAR